VKLRRLSADGHCLITPALASGSLARHAESSYERFVEETERPLDLYELSNAVEHILAHTDRHDAKLDPLAAPLLHRALPLSRREAAQPGVWRYLAIVCHPELVRHRWESQSWSTTRSRYWSLGTRHDSNAFSRLWWIAELTREGDSYALTEEVFAKQSLAISLFVRRFSSYRPSVAAFIEVMRAASPDDTERVVKELNGRLSTLVLESLDEGTLRGLIQELLEPQRLSGSIAG
jgi:Family of unknown function (DUF6339)